MPNCDKSATNKIHHLHNSYTNKLLVINKKFKKQNSNKNVMLIKKINQLLPKKRKFSKLVNFKIDR